MERFFLVQFILVVVVCSGAVSRKCQVCNPNDYNPVCVGGKVFSSYCRLLRLKCLGKTNVPLLNVRPCKNPIQKMMNARQENKTPSIDKNIEQDDAHMCYLTLSDQEVQNLVKLFMRLVYNK